MLDISALKKAVNIEAESFEIYLKQIFFDLSEITEELTKHKSHEVRKIPKATLLQYFDFPPFINEKWYNIFDRKNTEFVRFESFRDIMSKLYLGSFRESSEIIFQLYDFDNDGVIKKDDIRLMLSFLPLKEEQNSSKYKNQIDSLQDIQELLKQIFSEGNTQLNFNQFLTQIETQKSDIYIHMLCFLYYKKPFETNTINIIKKAHENKTNFSSNSNFSESINNCNYSNNSKSELDSQKSSRITKNKLIAYPVNIKTFLASESYLNRTKALQKDFSKQTEIISKANSDTDSNGANSKSSNCLPTVHMTNKANDPISGDIGFRGENDNISVASQKIGKEQKNSFAAHKNSNQTPGQSSNKQVRFNLIGDMIVKNINTKMNVNGEQQQKISNNSVIKSDILKSSTRNQSKDKLNKQLTAVSLGNGSKQTREYSSQRNGFSQYVTGSMNNKNAINNNNQDNGSNKKAPKKRYEINTYISDKPELLNKVNICQEVISQFNIPLETNKVTIDSDNIKDINKNNYTLTEESFQRNDSNISWNNNIIEKKNTIHYEDWLIKKDSLTNSLRKYFVSLNGKELSLYESDKKSKLISIIHINGYFIKDAQMETKKLNSENYYYFNLFQIKEKTYTFYTKSLQIKNKWIDNIKLAIGKGNFSDSYQLTETLGKGAFGVVKKAVGLQTKQTYAVKIITKANLQEAETSLIRSEIDVLRHCQHPNIVRLYEVFETADEFYLVMEYLEGGNLLDFLERYSESHIPEKIVKMIAYQIASAVNYLNFYGVIHRDLKPENIMLTDKDEGTTVKLIDFGLTRFLYESETLCDGFGTISYVAPEVLLRKPYNKQIDVWSLGVILYFLLSRGNLPFDDKNDNETKIGKKIVFADPPFPDKLFDKRSKQAILLTLDCLVKDPDKRIVISDVLKNEWLIGSINNQ